MPVRINGVWISLLPLLLLVIMYMGGVFAAGCRDNILIAVLSYSCCFGHAASAFNRRQGAEFYSSEPVPAAADFNNLLVNITGQRWGGIE